MAASFRKCRISVESDRSILTGAICKVRADLETRKNQRVGFGLLYPIHVRVLAREVLLQLLTADHLKI
jgi:hypothetical protein